MCPGSDKKHVGVTFRSHLQVVASSEPVSVDDFYFLEACLVILFLVKILQQEIFWGGVMITRKYPCS